MGTEFNYQNFVDNLNGMLTQSKTEYKEYLQNKEKEILLQQACEKLFNCVELYMSLKYQKQIMNYQEAYTMARNEKSDIKLLWDARELHRYFYNYREQFPDIAEAIKLYNSVYDRLKVKIVRHLVGRYKIWKMD